MQKIGRSAPVVLPQPARRSAPVAPAIAPDTLVLSGSLASGQPPQLPSPQLDDSAILDRAIAGVQTSASDDEAIRILATAADQVSSAGSFLALAYAAHTDVIDSVLSDVAVQKILTEGAGRVSDVPGLVAIAEAGKRYANSSSAGEAIFQLAMDSAVAQARTESDDALIKKVLLTDF